MTREKKLDELEVSEVEAGKVIERLNLGVVKGGNDKMLKVKDELLTPRGKAEAIVVDSLESASNCIVWLLELRDVEGQAQAMAMKTQLAAAMYILDTARGISTAQDKRRTPIDTSSLASDAMAHALRKRMEQRRPRIVEAAIPAIANDDAHIATKVSANIQQVDSQQTSAVNEATATDTDGGLGG